MSDHPIVIVGAGLSGLYAAYLLERAGVQDYLVLEGRDRIGGRLESVSHPGAADADRFDLGATWYWPDFQPQLHELIAELKIPVFEQYDSGAVLFEQSSSTPVARIDAPYQNSSQSMRVAGGMGALVQALASRLPVDKIRLKHKIVRILHAGDSLTEVEYVGPDGAQHVVSALHVLLAAPPRLVIDSIEFDPPLPTELAHQWSRCSTWMAPHAKYVAVFSEPFWRAEGLSGSARSYVGPMVEIHDASPQAGTGALFGFIGIPALARRKINGTMLLEMCRNQLIHIFGEQAAHRSADWLKDWSQDMHTATLADVNSGGAHSAAPPSRAMDHSWGQRFTGIASEWSSEFSGYVAGAIDAAGRGVTPLVQRRRQIDATRRLEA